MTFREDRVQIHLKGDEASKFLRAFKVYQQSRSNATYKEFVMHLIDVWMKIVDVAKDVKRLEKLLQYIDMINKVREMTVELKKEGLIPLVIALVNRIEEGAQRKDQF